MAELRSNIKNAEDLVVRGRYVYNLKFNGNSVIQYYPIGAR